VIAERRALVGTDAIRVDGRTVTFDRPGMAITLDGIGKGYVVDRAIDQLKAHGFADVMVEAGGDLVAAGHRDGERPWRLGIRRPRPGMKRMLRVTASDMAVATSGDYMQPFTSDFSAHHILDPRTGVSAPELASSTILAPNAALADGLATTTMVLGARLGRALVEEMDGCEGCFIGKDLTVTKTTGFRTI
jgi:thiamine biosynthesis lipoprotein